MLFSPVVFSADRYKEFFPLLHAHNAAGTFGPYDETSFTLVELVQAGVAIHGTTEIFLSDDEYLQKLTVVRTSPAGVEPLAAYTFVRLTEPEVCFVLDAVCFGSPYNEIGLSYMSNSRRQETLYHTALRHAHFFNTAAAALAEKNNQTQSDLAQALCLPYDRLYQAILGTAMPSNPPRRNEIIFRTTPKAFLLPDDVNHLGDAPGRSAISPPSPR